MSKHLVIGQRGEGIAARYLSLIGYSVHAKNVRLGSDEIDIVAYDPHDKVMVFVEVKTRSNFHSDYRPELNLDAPKRIKIARSARQWVLDHDYEDAYRVDLICIANEKVTNHYCEIISV